MAFARAFARIALPIALMAGVLLTNVAPAAASTSSTTNFAKVFTLGKTKLGDPWVHYAKGPNKFDCVGYVWYIFHYYGLQDKIGGEEKDLLKAADDALAAGNAAEAATQYSQLLSQDAGNIAAIAGLARCYVKTGALEQAKQTLALVPEAKRGEAAVAAARAALDLAEQAKSVGPIDELEKKIAADPLDHQARFDLAAALNAKGKRPEAVEHLLAIVKRDRKWNDDGARKQLVQLFDAWGPTDPATIEGRKRLSSVLF